MTLTALLVVIAGGFLLGGLLMALSGLRLGAEMRRRRWLKFAVYFVIVQGVLGCAFLGTPWLVGLALVILVVGAWELYGVTAQLSAPRRAITSAVAVIYVVLGSGFVATLLILPPPRAAFLYVVVAAFDGFSQVVGQWLGRRQLAPRLSPGKTVEGLIGGCGAAVALAWAIRDLASLTSVAAVGSALAIVSCALAGDLAASWLKRRAGVKDFSALLPGQGGMLDRFDSFIGAGALLAPALLLEAAVGGA